MYLTAQRVQDREGRQEVHAFLHAHDRGDFPHGSPLSVPESHPGRLVARSEPRVVRPGGNNVLAYLDIIVPDERWSPAVAEKLGTIGELMRTSELPWVVRFADAHVVFNSSPLPDPLAEYRRLAGAAVALLHAEGRLQ